MAQIDNINNILQNIYNSDFYNTNSQAVDNALKPLIDALRNKSKGGSIGDPVLDNVGAKEDAQKYLDNFGSSGNKIEDIFLKLRALGLTDSELIEYLQLYLQYQVGEQNYSRSLPAQQLANLQAAGMSRSAALGLLQNGGDSSTSLQPFESNADEVKQMQFERTMDIVKNVGILAQQIVSLASAPFDIRAKQITNNLLSNQSDLLSMQIQGMQDAAMFYQAIANADGDGSISKQSVLDQYKYIANATAPRALENGYNLGTVMYANSQEFKRAASNPFFWSVLSETMSKNNAASASIFEPERAEQLVASLRAATNYTNKQAHTEGFRSRIMSVQAFRDEALAQLRQDMERAKLLAEQHGYEFDDARSQAFLQRVETFNEYDFAQMDYKIQQLSYMRDPVMLERQRAALAAELDYNVAQYLYGHSIYSLKNGTLAQMMPNLTTSGAVADINTDVAQSADLLNWTKSYIEYCELGKTAELNAAQGVARTIFTGLGTSAATAFAGFKIFRGLQAAKAAASAAATAVQAGTPPIPFNLALPLVVPATTEYMLNGWQLNDGSMF